MRFGMTGSRCCLRWTNLWTRLGYKVHPSSTGGNRSLKKDVLVTAKPQLFLIQHFSYNYGNQRAYYNSKFEQSLVFLKNTRYDKNLDKLRKKNVFSLGYDYNPGGGPFWQSHLIGNEWMRCDFDKIIRVNGLKVQGSGQPGGRYWVQKFCIQYVGPDGNLYKFRDGAPIEAWWSDSYLLFFVNP